VRDVAGLNKEVELRVPRQRMMVAGIAATMVLSLAACASSNRNTNSSTANAGSTDASATSGGGGASDTASSGAADTSGSSGSSSASGSSAAGGGSNATFTFGAAGAPSMFDPLYATDGESFRPARQMMEGLVGFKAGTADLEPKLAESWTQSKDGKTWTFKIRQNVKFQDGTALDSKAVCYNLDRMYSQTGAGATQAQYWSDTMGGFKGQKDDAGKEVPSLYVSCAADGDNAVVKIARATSKFPSLLGLPSFSIQSPTALDKYKANDVKASG